MNGRPGVVSAEVSRCNLPVGRCFATPFFTGLLGEVECGNKNLLSVRTRVREIIGGI